MDRGLAAPLELLDDAGDVGTPLAAAPAGRAVAVVGLVLVGLAVLVRELIDGRFGGTDAALAPIVVRLVFSWAESWRPIRELAVPMVDIRDGLLFSSRAPDATVPPSSLPRAPGFLAAAAVTGRVGGLLMVLPDVRADSALVLPGVGATGALEVLARDEVVAGFLCSAACGFAPVAIRLSILQHGATRLDSTTPQRAQSRHPQRTLTLLVSRRSRSRYYCSLMCCSRCRDDGLLRGCSNGAWGWLPGRRSCRYMVGPPRLSV